MRTTAVLHPPVLDLPPPFDALILRVALVRVPRQIRRVARAIGVVRVVVRAVKQLWARTPFRSWSRTDRPVSVFGARGPPS